MDASTVYETETEGGAAATPAPSAAGSGGSAGGASGAAESGPGFAIDADAVLSIAAQIAAQGVAAAEVVVRLRSQLRAAGEPWGTEEIGKSFGHGYTGQVNQSFPALASIGSALAGVANGLVAHAQAHEQVETAITERLGSIAKDGATGSAQP